MALAVNKIEGIINKASNVIIMAHQNLDLDALGSSLGMYYLCKHCGKNTFLLIEEQETEKGVMRALKELKAKELTVKLKTLDELRSLIDEETVLIILDVHTPNIMQNKEVLALVKQIIVIDHHVQNQEMLFSSCYSYIDEEISSTVEIIVELLKELNIYIPPSIATVMLAGIVVDTNHFSIKTTDLTYEAASFLCKQEADLRELQYLLKEDFDRYLNRHEIISRIKVVNHNLAIGVGLASSLHYPDDIAKVADTLLTFDQIEAAFTIAKIKDDLIGISARSLGVINVQKIMEQMGGGGHYTEAATQLSGITLEEAEEQLLMVINQVLNEGGI